MMYHSADELPFATVIKFDQSIGVRCGCVLCDATGGAHVLRVVIEEDYN
jgi:hypothetical protein